MFCCTLLYVHSSIAIILMWKRELVALLNLSSWSLVVVKRLFFVVPLGCLQFVFVVFLIILTYYFCIAKFRTVYIDGEFFIIINITALCASLLSLWSS